VPLRLFLAGNFGTGIIAMKTSGFTLIELLIAISIGAVLVLLAAPAFFEAFAPGLKSSAQNLAADLRFAQNEAVRQGDASPGGGSFRERKVFVVFDIENNRYSAWRWEDSNGNNMRDAGEFNPDLGADPAGDAPVRTWALAAGVHFSIHSGVMKSACSGSGPAPGNSVSFQPDPNPPCNGRPCIRFNGRGFMEGLNGAAYLSNGNDAYAVSANRAGLFSSCKWSTGASNWVTAH
jgi:prepilin-type N-terminal cleavage/methylation domain-containing protein